MKIKILLPQLIANTLVGTILCASFAARAAAPSTNSIPATNTGPRLVIVKAVFGDLSDSSATADVTKEVAALVRNNAIEVDVNPDNFGDPAAGTLKQLKVDFTIDGVAGSKAICENVTFKLSPQDKLDPARNSNPPKLVIRKAVYGALPAGGKIDVTGNIASLVSGDALKVKASNDSFGDPAVGEAKQLQVDYTLNGKDESKTVAEDQSLEISGVSQ